MADKSARVQVQPYQYVFLNGVVYARGIRGENRLGTKRAVLEWLQGGAVTLALWSRTNKNPDVSTGPLARPFANLLAPITHLVVAP